MFVGLEHTAIASPDPAKLARWYVDHLDFRINFEYDGNYFVRASNGTMLEIIPSEGTRGEQKMRDPGIRHLAIEVKDFDAAHASLKEKGVKFDHISDHGLSLGIYFRDPDGNGLEVSYELPREKWPRQDSVFAPDVVNLGLFPGPWEEEMAKQRAAVPVQ